MLIVANWKAYVESRMKAKGLFQAAKRLSAKLPKSVSQIIIAPPAPYLGLLAAGNKSKVRFAAQDLSNTTGGAHTGEITAAALRELGVAYVIVGHSERRAAGETDAVVAGKAAHALAHGLTPILCIGEATLTPKERAQVVIAYEPLWAIGKSAADAIQPADLAEMVLYLRKLVSAYVPAGKTKILYGGSVEPGNIRMLAGGSGIDGLLIGHASADAATVSALVKAIS